MDDDQHIISLWRDAARDLKIGIVAPFSAMGPRGDSIGALVWLRDFGSPRGALVCASDDPDNLAVRGLDWGYEIVGYDPAAYPARYDRRLFMRILAGLGWEGSPAERPAWLDAIREPKTGDPF
jgi:hypothetical protein